MDVSGPWTTTTTREDDASTATDALCYDDRHSQGETSGATTSMCFQ